MDEVGEQLLARARLALNQHGGLRVGDVQGQLDGAADAGRLADDAVFGVALVQHASQAHHLGRELVALKRRADLDGDAFDERDLVLVERLARLAPDEAEQPEGLLADADGRDERGAAAERRVEGEADGLGQRRVETRSVLRSASSSTSAGKAEMSMDWPCASISSRTPEVVACGAALKAARLMALPEGSTTPSAQ